jgi:beta-galactosidase
MAGRHTRTWSYSGPNSAIVHLDTDARPGRNAYVDTESPLPGDMPASLVSADWIRTASADSLYSAVDFVQVSVPVGTVITVAHDDRLARPAWLAAQFHPTKQKITILGRPMTLFTRVVRNPEDGSVTMGDNTEAAKDAGTGTNHPNMYLVFMNAAPKTPPGKK